MKKGDDFYSRLSEEISHRLHKYGISEEAATNLFKDETLHREIDYLRKNGVPDAYINRVVENGLAHALSKGQRPSIGPDLVAFAVYDGVRKTKKYAEIADELVEGGIIQERDVKRFRGMFDQGLKLHKKETKKAAGSLERLLRNAAVYVPFGVSGLILFKGLLFGGITGAVVGGGVADYTMFYGVVFFLLGLAMHYFLYKN